MDLGGQVGVSNTLLDDVQTAESELIVANLRRRHALDRRGRAVWDARDAGHSHGEISRAMSRAHQAAGEEKTIPRSRVVGILSDGYPEDDEAA